MELQKPLVTRDSWGSGIQLARTRNWWYVQELCEVIAPRALGLRNRGTRGPDRIWGTNWGIWGHGVESGESMRKRPPFDSA